VSSDRFRGDLIEITGLRVFGRHGVLPAEQRDGQHFVVDAVLAVDHRRAGVSDELADTVHYGEVAEELAHAVAATRFDLIEALAEHLAALALARPGVTAVRIRVGKPSAPIAAEFRDVAVVVVRP
jgi:dihydroneopterin aldolase